MIAFFAASILPRLPRRRDFVDKAIRRLLAVQCGGTVLVAVVCLAGGVEWSLSALVGGGIGIAATAAAALSIALTRGASPGSMLGGQYLAELAKFGVTVGLFIVTFLSYRDVAAGPLFAAYAATLLAYGVALALDS